MDKPPPLPEPAPETGASDASVPDRGAWPPRPAALPENPYRVADELGLELDRRAAVVPPAAPDFSKTKLDPRIARARRAPVVALGAPPPSGAVPYDPRRAFGRTRWHEIFDPTEEDFARRQRDIRREGALVGAFAMIVVCASFAGWKPLPILASATVGAFVGGAVAALADSALYWLLGMGLAGIVLAPFIQGSRAAIAIAASLVIGWVVGLVRETRR